MAIIKSKVLGLYVLNTGYGQTDPFIVGDGANESARLADALANGAAIGDQVILTNGNTFTGIFTIGGSQGAETVTELASSNLNLALAATNTNMDISNTVNEIVARDGSGGSETYIVSGAQTWSFAGDGFLTNDAGDSVHDLWTTSSGSKYVLVRFDTDVTAAGSRKYVGQGLVESFSLSGGFDDNVSYSFTVSGYGKLYTHQN